MGWRTFDRFVVDQQFGSLGLERRFPARAKHNHHGLVRGKSGAGQPALQLQSRLGGPTGRIPAQQTAFIACSDQALRAKAKADQAVFVSGQLAHRCLPAQVPDQQIAASAAGLVATAAQPVAAGVEGQAAHIQQAIVQLSRGAGW